MKTIPDDLVKLTRKEKHTEEWEVVVNSRTYNLTVDLFQDTIDKITIDNNKDVYYEDLLAILSVINKRSNTT